MSCYCCQQLSSALAVIHIAAALASSLLVTHKAAVLSSAPAVIHIAAALCSSLLSFTEQLSSLLFYVYHEAADLCSVIASLWHSQSSSLVCSRYLSSVPKSLAIHTAAVFPNFLM